MIRRLHSLRRGAIGAVALVAAPPQAQIAHQQKFSGAKANTGTVTHSVPGTASTC